MRVHDTLNREYLTALAERMGSEASTTDAVEMADFLVHHGYEGYSLEDLPPGVWELALASVRSGV